MFIVYLTCTYEEFHHSLTVHNKAYFIILIKLFKEVSDSSMYLSRDIPNLYSIVRSRRSCPIPKYVVTEAHH